MNIAFIPARCGSESIPFKNIKIICGKPLIYWALLALTKSKNIDQIYVATDCDEIKDTVRDFNFDTVQIFDRSSTNASNTASTESVMLEFLDSKDFSGEDLFVLVQATTPFTSSDDFDNAINILKSNFEIDSLLSCVESKRFFWTKNGNAINYDYYNRPLRQDFDGILMENGAFYINTVENINKHKNRLSGNIHPYLMPEYSAIEADEEDDWIIIEKLMYKYVVNNKPSKIIKLFATDVDGVLTDAGMYYDNNGNELKRFNTHDGMAFKILKEKGICTAMITSEKTNIVKLRANKLQVDYLFQGVKGREKLEVLEKICIEKNMSLSEVAYIGDDINDYNVLSSVGFPACPNNAITKIKNIEGITHLSKSGGDGAVREFVELLLNE
ncbi:acylneuraminate cytidylyltransferase [Candidatus Woesearchaeota archaeon]|nr:acylneuraminate cytidylyltransferase [Candidatus Neomarinimicrobiota bacterium]MBT5043352.1 acylneuraminate cytidylyltransferase [Candidatus Woesearchaeota archaeon]